LREVTIYTNSRKPHPNPFASSAGSSLSRRVLDGRFSTSLEAARTKWVNSRPTQVLNGTGRYNTLFVVVVDRALQAIIGHHLLDMNEKFDVKGDHLRNVRFLPIPESR
jgi:hypothetical protein